MRSPMTVLGVLGRLMTVLGRLLGPGPSSILAASVLAACGGSGDSSPKLVRTEERCAAAKDCSATPTSHCKDARTIVSYEVATCVANACQWSPREDPCPLACQDNYCISARPR